MYIYSFLNRWSESIFLKSIVEIDRSNCFANRIVNYSPGLPSRELTRHSPPEAVPFLWSFRAAVGAAGLQVPLSCDPDPPEVTATSCSLLVLVLSTKSFKQGIARVDKLIWCYFSNEMFEWKKKKKRNTSCGLSPVGVDSLGWLTVFTEVWGSWFPWSDWLTLSDWFKESNSSSSASKSEWLKLNG